MDRNGRAVVSRGDASSPRLPCVADLVLLACNWSTMGDGFFVCHHLAALYAYGYVLVSAERSPRLLKENEVPTLVPVVLILWF